MLKLIIICLIFGWLSSLAAKKKGRDPALWFLIGFAFGILGLAAAWFLPAPNAEKEKKPITLEVSPLLEEDQKEWYYLNSQNEQCGPVAFQEIKNLYKEGTILPNTFIWHPSLVEWTPAEKLEIEKNIPN